MSNNRTTAILFAVLSGLLVAGALFLMRQSMTRQDSIEIYVLRQEVGAGDGNSADLYETRTVDPAGLANHPNPNLLRPALTDMWVNEADGQLEAFYELEFTRSLSAGS